MKTKLLSLLLLTAAVVSLPAQAPTPTPTPAAPAAPGASPPAADPEEARRAIEEMVRQARQNQLQNQPTGEGGAPAGTAQPVPTLPTPGARPGGVRQFPPGMQLPGVPGQNTVQQPAPTAPGGAVPNVAGQVAPARSALNPDELVDDEMLVTGPGMPIEQLIEIYTELTGRIILKPATLAAPQSIDLNIPKGALTRGEMVQAIDTYLSLNGLTTVPMGDKFVLLVANADAPQQGAAMADIPVDELPEASQFITKIVQLEYINPTELQPVLQVILKTTANSFIAIDSTRTLVLRDYAINIKRALELIEQIDVAVPVEYETKLIPIKYALAGDIAQVLGGLTSGGSVTSVGSSSAGGLTGGTGGFGVGGAGAAGGVPGSQGLGGTMGTAGGRYGTQARGGISTGQGASAQGRSAFQNRLNQLVNQVGAGGGGAGQVQILGETKIIADERTNSLLVFANREDMKTIEDIISKMDVVLAQVLIEAIIMEVSLDDSLDFGVSAIQRSEDLTEQITGRGAINNGQFLNSTNGIFPDGFSYFANLGESWDVALRAIAKDGSINVLSRPRVQTSHAVEAQIQVGDTVPYVTSTYFGYSVGGQSSSQYQERFVGIDLAVLPLINQEGLVVMDIQQNIEQLGVPTQIDGNDVPTTSRRFASAKVAVRDGESIMLGGFISSNRTKSRSGVPFLKDIPMLGYLFSSTSKQAKRVELVVLIRPTVLPTPADAAKMVGSTKDLTPNVKAAEVEFEQEEQRQLERANEAIMRMRLGLPER